MINLKCTTPGPWIYRPIAVMGGQFVLSNKELGDRPEDLICSFSQVPRLHDARIITAESEMLEVLEELINTESHMRNWDKTRAVVKKARTGNDDPWLTYREKKVYTDEDIADVPFG